MEILLVVLSMFYTVSHIFCLIIGVKIGQKVVQGKEVTVPNPITAIKEYQEEKQQSEEEERTRTMLENIENYNGTELGQRDV